MNSDETRSNEEVLVDFLEGEPSVVDPDPAFEGLEDPELMAHEMDPSVPEDLLELHMELEDASVDPDEFKAVFG